MTEDATQAAAMSAVNPHPYSGNPEHVICLMACATDRWQRMVEDAKAMDRMAVREHGQLDRDHHLCAMQRQQARAGYTLVSIQTNIYGFTVRDTLNDGAGVLLRAEGGSRGGDGSARRAIEFARRWHAQDPDRREVILGYVAQELRQEWEEALADALK
ncbi:MAG: hypothetical protein EPN79_02245 [Burkholderiaceae bacterium]|nr:MAG: hypothetical protein EPN79_02245 [Burkholderiaceae bacterium]TBR76144.1 MAG: hypothetical protein EPN64_09030 [Burkholderiaceae bacterium]